MPVAAAADAELAATIADAAPQLGLTLTQPQADRLVAYVRLIERWNGTYNLTAVRDPRAMVVQHILDCLAVVAPLRRRLGATAGSRLLDVGSGAGLPGLVIAATEPALDVVCVDSVGKKASFITHAAGALGLKISLPSTAGSRTCLPASHSTSSPAAPSRRSPTSSRRRDGCSAMAGSWMAMKGKVPSAEMAALDGFTFHVEPLAVPGLDAARCLVWAQPAA